MLARTTRRYSSPPTPRMRPSYVRVSCRTATRRRPGPGRAEVRRRAEVRDLAGDRDRLSLGPEDHPEGDADGDGDHDRVQQQRAAGRAGAATGCRRRPRGRRVRRRPAGRWRSAGSGAVAGRGLRRPASRPAGPDAGRPRAPRRSCRSPSLCRSDCQVACRGMPWTGGPGEHQQGNGRSVIRHMKPHSMTEQYRSDSHDSPSVESHICKSLERPVRFTRISKNLRVRRPVAWFGAVRPRSWPARRAAPRARRARP